MGAGQVRFVKVAINSHFACKGRQKEGWRGQSEGGSASNEGFFTRNT